MTTESKWKDTMTLTQTGERMGWDRNKMSRFIRSGRPFPHLHSVGERDQISVLTRQYEQWVDGTWVEWLWQEASCVKARNKKAEPRLAIKPIRQVS